jgi:hypothetical protein
VTDPQWYYATSPELNWYVPDSTEITRFMTRLFGSAGHLVERYSLEKVDQGLYFICSHGSEYFFAARECDDKDLQVEWVLSILPLYRDLFARVCTDHFGHLDDGPEPPSPLNTTCYMFWDLDCLEGAAMFPGEEHLVDPIFEVLEGALRLRSVACQESALHGLGHLQMYHKQRVRRIIGEFLEENDSLPTELKDYALGARTGCVQ